MINNDLIQFFEKIEEEDSISSFKKPATQPYSFTYVRYGVAYNEYHKHNFIASNEERAKNYVINYLTRMTTQEREEYAKGLDTDEILESLEQFLCKENRDCKLIDICYDNGDIIYQGEEPGDDYDPETDTITEDDL